jgi:hypothetical protein
MAEPNAGTKLPLTIFLTPEVAQRLKLAAEAQHRAAADVAAEMLERHLPRLPGAGPKKGSIPYS